MSDLPPITVQRATPNSDCLQADIPQLARVQGGAHHTRLPDAATHAAQITQNFRHAIVRNMVEIWHIAKPVSGAVFLSPLRKGGLSGLQMDDVVVLPEVQGKGYGAALICFTAALAKARGGNFVAWECERDNPASKTYQNLCAAERADFKPFRLSKEMLDQLRPMEGASVAGMSMTVSPRFSLFRTMCHGITGYDIPPDEKPNGIQVEDIDFEDVATAQKTLSAMLLRARREQDIQFADVILRPDHPDHLKLITHFDAAQNTYSGSPAVLWELAGDAFDAAAEKAATLNVIGDMG